jgi:class 3 adenylate cyclase/tetratricopeptide (TPR) repeat protein
MLCSKCAHENRGGAKFCEECAAPLARACANCGSQLSPTAKFCPECAQPTGLVREAKASERFASPQGYTPKHLAEKILTSKTALEGERKQVTVLFADVRGSMELFADHDPEETRKLLDPVLEHMMEAVHRYEGTVNQVMGDGVMALFGAPIAHEDHAVRACYAALRMQETVKHYAEGVRRAEGIPIQIRVGLNSGLVVVRSIGSDLRMDYSAVGQTTNVAARMEQMATPGAINIPADTLALAEGYVQVRPLGPMKVKGLELPLEVFEIIGASAVRSRLHATAARGLSRFVGRAAEMEQLNQALERTRSGHGQLVAVVGEPGVGKSRLYWEFTRSHRTQGCLVLESGSVSYGKATAFLPILDLLRAYFRIENADDPRMTSEKITGKLLSLDRAFEPWLSALLWLLDIAVEDAQWQRLDPTQRRFRALEGVKRLLVRESQIQPLVVIFEDLHWIDAETQALLDSLVESLPTARLLLLVNYRPEYQNPWTRKTYYRQLSIDPLPPESADELLSALLGNNAGLLPLKQLLIERTDGNPFFLEESVRTLVETRVLSGERGAYVLTNASHIFQIPNTAQAILAARIDRLSADDKRLLQAASVIGKDVPFALLQRIAELPEEHLREGVAHLQSSEFLYEAKLFPDVEYTFRHALTHDVAYDSLLHDRRRTLHAQIMHAMETLYSQRLNEHVEHLARHAFRGEVWEKAVIFLRQAGVKSFARSANREAATYFENALTALDHFPKTRETLEQGIDVRLALRNALWPLGEFEAGFGYLREAEQLANELADHRRLGWITAYQSEHTRQTGHAPSAPAFAERALAVAELADDLPLRVASNYYLGTAYFAAGEYLRTDEFFSKILQLLEGDRFRERCGLAGFPAVMSRGFWTLALTERGEFDHALLRVQEGIKLAEALDHPYSLIFTLRSFAYLHGSRGNLDHAVPLAERSLALSHERGISQLWPDVADVLGHLYALSGRTADALSLLREALTIMEAKGHIQWRSPLIAHLGEAYLLDGKMEDASRTAMQGLILSRKHGHRGSEAWTLRLLGEIALRQEPPDVAATEAHYRSALTLASELGMHPLVAHCHLGLATMYRRSGKRQRESLEHLAISTKIYRQLNMPFWVEKVESMSGVSIRTRESGPKKRSGPTKRSKSSKK